MGERMAEWDYIPHRHHSPTIVRSILLMSSTLNTVQPQSFIDGETRKRRQVEGLVRVSLWPKA